MSRPLRLVSVLSALRNSPIGIFAFRRDGNLHSLARNRGLPAEEVDLRRSGPIAGTPEPKWRRGLARVVSGRPVRTHLRVGAGSVDLQIEPWRNAEGEVIGGVGLTVDVGDREEALRRLRARERRLRRITDHLGDVLVELDLEGSVRFVTPSARALFQREPASLRGRLASELLHPDDRARVARLFQRAVARDEGYTVDARVLRPDGSTRWTTSRADFVRTAAGEPRLLLFIRDVTERREAARRAEQRATLMQGISELSRELLALPPEGLGPGLERALARCCELTGVDACTLYVMDPHTLEQRRVGWSAPGVPDPPMPDRRDALRMVWLGRQLAAGHSVHAASPEDWPPEAHVERERMRADGVHSVLILGVRSETSLVGSIQLLGMTAPRPIAEDDMPALRILAEMLVGTFRRKLSLEALERGRTLEAEVARLSRRFLGRRGAEIEDVLPDALDLARRIARAPRVMMRLPTPEGGVETHRADAGPDAGSRLPEHGSCPWIEAELDAGRRVVLSDLQPLPEPARADVRHLRGLGVGSLLAVPLRPAEGPTGALAALSRERDRFWSREECALLERLGDLLVRVVDREAGERRLGARRAALRQSQKLDAVGRLAGGIAHEFNNLLMVIAGHTESLAGRVDEASETRRDLREIDAATERAAALTRQLLTLSGPESGRPGPLALDALLREGERMWRRTLGDACTLALELDAGDAAVLGERSDLEQILLNLLVNARDAMPRGGRVTVSTRRLPPASDAAPGTPGRLELAVEDEGEGIPEAEIPEIFEPFYSTKAPGQGTGLGLSIVRRAADRLGARVLVESGRARGACFRLLLPETFERPARAPAREPVAGRHGSGTILLAEDEDAVRRLMRRILQGAGYDVLEARDGAEALERMLAEPQRIDAVVSDVRMPRLGGGALRQALRERGVDVPVLLVSGYPQDEDAAPGGASGGRLLYKPFTRAALLDAVAELLHA